MRLNVLHAPITTFARLTDDTTTDPDTTDPDATTDAETGTEAETSTTEAEATIVISDDDVNSNNRIIYIQKPQESRGSDLLSILLILFIIVSLCSLMGMQYRMWRGLKHIHHAITRPRAQAVF